MWVTTWHLFKIEVNPETSLHNRRNFQMHTWLITLLELNNTKPNGKLMYYFMLNYKVKV
jgi:hypothetical protein